TPQEIYRQATSGSPVLNDSLTGPGSGWDAGTKAIKYGCLFTAGAYHVIMQQQGHFVGCFAETTNFSNFAFQVEMTILKGEGGGLLFRAGGTNTFGYRFFFGRGNYDLNYGNTSLL